MSKSFFCLLIVIFITCKSTIAQDQTDALRYGFIQYQGTARGMGIGSALGSIGGDFSSLSVNPAGIGIYRSNELSFSPSFSINNNSSDYLGSSLSSNSSKLNLSHIGMVLTNAKKGNSYRRSNWKTASFAFGLNRLLTFKNEYSYTGKNYSNSLIERYAEDFNALGGLNANTLSAVNFAAYSAYQTYLIDKDFSIGGDSTKAKSYVPYQDGIQQTKKVFQSGGMNEFVISAGGNYKEKILLGATLGIDRINYKRALQFNEEDISGNLSNNFKFMHFTENLRTEGTGVNLKIGAIFKPVLNFRFGIALHTPTAFDMKDSSAITMESHTDSLLSNPISKYVQDTALVFNYTLYTPYKAIASATVLFNTHGFLTADLEFVDYSSMKYDYGTGYENESAAINQVIKNSYKSAVNIRVGAEAKFKDWSVRAGYANYGSPDKKNPSYGGRTVLSGGIGCRGKYWFLDAAIIHSLQNTKELPYVLARSNANVQSAISSNNTTNVVLTYGWKFQ